jgi:hypothetical protein
MSKCEHRQSHYDFLYTVSKKKSYWVSLFYRITCGPRYVSHMILTFYYCISLSCIVWIYSLTIMIVSQKYRELLV